MISMEARTVAEVRPEQRACFEELGDDIRDVAADPDAAGAAIDALAFALTSRRQTAWASAVTALDALLAHGPHDASAGARRRLSRFVAENADLVART
jgi:hypothetical protein